MKIKTVWTTLDRVKEFDAWINEALANGWRLAKREVLPGMQYNQNAWARRLLYAELVQLDEPVAPPEPADPFDALRAVRDFCEAQDPRACMTTCPLSAWCEDLRRGGDPTDWAIPEKEVAT